MEDIASKLEDLMSDEETMSQLKDLAGMLGIDFDGNIDPSSIKDNLFGQEEKKQDSDFNFDDFDIGKIMNMKKLFSGNGNNKNLELLNALRPHLKEENQSKLDKSIKMMKLLELLPFLKESGILGGDLF